MNKMNLYIILLLIIGLFLMAGYIKRRYKARPEIVSPDIAGPNMISPALFNAGLKIIDFSYESETITAAVWYPTTQEPKDYVYRDADDHQSRVALNASLARKNAPYPLILFSHGGFGCGYSAAYFLEFLASHGYIAVAPDYVDTEAPAYEKEIAFCRIKTGRRDSKLHVLRAAKAFVDEAEADVNFMLAYVEKHRLNQTSFIIAQMIALNQDPVSDFYQTIDEKSIGMAGHSLGGLTTLAKTGAYPKPGYTDERIKAALLFSAPAHPFEDNINKIDIPIMMMVGDNDEPFYGPQDVPRDIIYNFALPPKYLLILREATHFTFGNRGSGKIPLYQAVETVPQTRAISRYGLAFFEKYLKKSKEGEAILNQKDAALFYYIKEEKSGDVSEWGEKPAPGASRNGDKGGIREEIRKRILERLGR